MLAEPETRAGGDDQTHCGDAAKNALVHASKGRETGVGWTLPAAMLRAAGINGELCAVRAKSGKRTATTGAAPG
ncbi:MAG: hypothetical protein IPJ62_17205 [Betaproteobacteria bacterium]|nr:hypothetical protein [Betaproteobacteria bacterium]